MVVKLQQALGGPPVSQPDECLPLAFRQRRDKFNLRSKRCWDRYHCIVACDFDLFPVAIFNGDPYSLICLHDAANDMV
jgi:hypothetical protein